MVSYGYLGFASRLGSAGSVAVAVVALVVSAAGAQDVLDSATAARCPVSTITAAQSAGADAAGQRFVVGYAVAGFVTGVPVGFMLPIALGEGLAPSDAETQVVVASTVGFGATLALGARAATLPSTYANQVRGCAPDGRAAFEQAYETRLRQRRLRATWWGGATGAVTGVGLLVLLVSQLGT